MGWTGMSWKRVQSAKQGHRQNPEAKPECAFVDNSKAWYYPNVILKSTNNKSMMCSTVTAKIPKELKQKLKERGINISEVIRRALEEEIAAREEKELREMLDEIHANLGERLSEEDVVCAVRATREMR
jgi:post-segregation antitoxin (ccd killing protein)